MKGKSIEARACPNPRASSISANRNEFLMTLNRRSTKSAMLFGLELGVLLLAGTGLCLGQALPPVRGVYTPGFNATNSGVIPEPGLSYANFFMDYSFDQFRSASGATVAENNAAVFIDINAFEWVTKKKILGANYAVAALLPFRCCYREWRAPSPSRGVAPRRCSATAPPRQSRIAGRPSTD